MKLNWHRRAKSRKAIVFIHGLFSSTDSAWRGDHSFWPDLVIEEPSLQDFSVCSFDYDTRPSSGTYSLDDATSALNECFKLESLAEMNTVAFVAHSMGGIIARHFLVTQRETFIDANISVGLLLVASPSLGSKYANLVTNIGLIHQVQVDALRFDQENIWLNNLDQQFMKLKEGGKIHLLGRELVEADPTYLRGRFFRKRQIVPMISANRYFGHAIKIPRSNHNSIAKPADKDAFQHQILVDFILNLDKARASRAGAAGSIVDAPLAPAAIGTVEPPAELTPVVRVAIGAKSLGLKTIPPETSSAAEVCQIAFPLAQGSLMARLMSSWLVKRHGNALEVFEHALTRDNISKDELVHCVPWLRSVVNNDKVRQLPSRVIAALRLDDADAAEIAASIYGMCGLADALPRVNWDDRRVDDKQCYQYVQAHMRSALWAKADYQVGWHISRALWMLNSHERFKAFQTFDYILLFREVRSAHVQLILEGLKRGDAPDTMMQVFLARICLAPNERVVADLKELVRSEDWQLSEQASQALAFFPVSSSEKRELCQPACAFACAAGIEGWVDALPTLSAFVQADEANVHIAAAWAIGRMVPVR